MHKIEACILTLCKTRLSQSETKEIITLSDNPDFLKKLDAFTDINSTHALIYLNLKKIAPGLAITENLKKTYLLNVKRNILLKREFEYVRDILNKNGIGVIPLKGIGLIESVYSDFEARYMIDIDILVRETDLKKVSSILKDNNYKESKAKPCEQQVFFSKNLQNGLPVFMEVHWEIMPPRPYRLSLPNVWKNKKMSLEDHFIISSMHIRRHIRHCGFKDFYDIFRILSQASSLNYSYIREMAVKNRIKSTCSFAIWAVNNIFGADFPHLFKPGAIRKTVFQRTFSKYIFFKHVKNKFKLSILRLFLFDSVFDLIIYLFRVSLVERKIKA